MVGTVEERRGDPYTVLEALGVWLARLGRDEESRGDCHSVLEPLGAYDHHTLA